jgi:hypothetical protein
MHGNSTRDITESYLGISKRFGVFQNFTGVYKFYIID